MAYKECCHCHTIKPLEEYHRSQDSKDGHNPRCKACRHNDRRKYLQNNKEKINETRNLWRKANPERDKENQRKWIDNNRERWNKYQREYAATKSKMLASGDKTIEPKRISCHVQEFEPVEITPVVTGPKTCSRCGFAKPMDAFYNHINNKDGKQSHCIECTRIQNNAWKAANSERNKEYNRAYMQEHRARLRVQAGDEKTAAEPSCPDSQTGPDNMAEKTKVCCHCMLSKPLDAFRIDKGRHDGVQAYCKECHGKYNKDWYAKLKARANQCPANITPALSTSEDTPTSLETRLMNLLTVAKAFQVSPAELCRVSEHILESIIS